MPAALDGIRVLDLSSMVLGPMAGQLLGDMGADVIKVEAPEGDLMRAIGPRRSEGMAAFYLNNNRNKRGIVLDLKRPSAVEAFFELVKSSDVVLTSVRDAASTRLGIGYAQLKQVNPKLIYCHVKGYSERGLQAGQASYDDVGQAQSGMAALQSVLTGEPRYAPMILADKVTALHAAFAIAAAIAHCQRSGEGQQVDVPMFETMVSFNQIEHLWGEVFQPPLAPTGYVPVSTASRRPFRTRDGHYICVLPYNQGHWQRFCQVVGDPELTADPRYITHAARQSDQPGFWAEVGRRVAARDRDDWIAALTAADVPHGQVNSMDDLLTNPHLQSIDFWQTIDSSEGQLRSARSPLEFSATPAVSPPRPAPRLGEHTVAVMHDLGMSDDRIRALGAAGAFGPKFQA